MDQQWLSLNREWPTAEGSVFIRADWVWKETRTDRYINVHVGDEHIKINQLFTLDQATRLFDQLRDALYKAETEE